MLVPSPPYSALCYVMLAAAIFVACHTAPVGAGPRDTVSTASAERAKANAEPSIDIVNDLVDQGDYQAAIAVAAELYAITEREHGPDALESGEVLDVLVHVRRIGGLYAEPETLELAELAVDIKERCDARPISLAHSLHNLALVHHQNGRLAAAEPIYERALALIEDSVGREHPDHARIASAYADLLGQTGRLDLAFEAMTGACNTLATDDAYVDDLADCYNRLAALHYRSQDYEQALSLWQRTLELRRRYLPPDHPKISLVRNNYSITAHLLGRYDEARDLQIESLEALRRSQAVPHLVRHAFTSLAEIYYHAGDYPAAAACLDSALATFAPDRSVPELEQADLYERKASTLFVLGDLEAAKNLNLKAARIAERHGDQVILAKAALSLGEIYLDLGRFEDARAKYNEALELRKAVYGPRSAQVAWAQQELGIVDVLDNRPDLALPKLETARQWLIAAPDADDIAVAWCTYYLASCLTILDQLDRALELYAEAAEALQGTAANQSLLGPITEGWAHALARSGRPREAFDKAIEAERISNKLLAETAAELAERQALRYAEARVAGQHLALSLLIEELSSDPEAVHRTWDQVIRSRARVLDEVASRQRQARLTADPQAAALSDSLESVRRQIAALTIRTSIEDSETDRAILSHLLDSKERLERLLAQKMAPALTARTGDLRGVTEALPDRTALLAFAIYRHTAADRHQTPSPRHANLLRRPLSDLRPDPGVPSYAALIQRAGEQPEIVPLGEAAPIDRAVRSWVTEFDTERHGGKLSTPERELACRSAGASLRALVWDPIADRVADSERLFIVPDGTLNLVNFAVLPEMDGRYLIESAPVIHYLSAERDLIAFEELEESSGRGILLVGGVDFESGGTTEAHPGTGPQLEGASFAFRTASVSCEAFQTAVFGPLPGTALEVETLDNLWRQAGTRAGQPNSLGAAKLLTSSQATEAAFRMQAPGKRIVHLATHGFFLDCSDAEIPPPPRVGSAHAESDQPAVRAPDTRGMKVRARRASDPFRLRMLADNPLLRAGLVLAGANVRDSTFGADDGILSAEEIAALDLRGVEWAVLSACDTGTGDVSAGEGIFGLRRAFRIAGVRSVLMSLWPVEDASTRAWMNAFYEARLLAGHDTAVSVRTASLELLEQRRSAGETTHPIYWGSFMAEGDWR